MSAKVFTLPTQVKYGDKVLHTSFIPKDGDYVIANNKQKYKLVKQIGRKGGEGVVYLTNDPSYVAKIYKPNRITLFRFHKIKLLALSGIDIKEAAFPKYILFNKKNEFVGYLMRKVSGIDLKTSVFIPPLLKKKFPSWKRKELVQLAISILEIVKKFHSYNIILGDINPGNILIKSEKEVYFIDVDSFQIESYPCPVGMIPYTRLINHGKKYDSYLRTKEDDIFALATLIFQILLPGKLPYSFKGGGREKDNMKPENFPYRCYDGEGYKNPPDGQWVYIWSHLPRKLKHIFCQIFKHQEIVSIEDMLKELSSYLFQIEKGWQSNEIFPSNFKKINSKGKVLNAKSNPNDKSYQITCKDCGKIFYLTKGEIDFYKSKNLSLPKRCKTCRKLKHKRFHSNNQENSFLF